MAPLDRQRMFAALLLAIMALFVSSRSPFAGRWRPLLQRAAIIAFVLAVAVAIAQIALWWGSASD